jgi:hypothetical protein
MLLRFVDFYYLDFTFDVKEGQTIDEIRLHLVSLYGEHLFRASFYHGGRELRDEFVMTPDKFSDGDVIAIYNRWHYPEKSYPKVDSAIHVVHSRYHDYFIDVREPLQLSQPRNSDDLDSAARNTLREISEIERQYELYSRANPDSVPLRQLAQRIAELRSRIYESLAYAITEDDAPALRRLRRSGVDLTRIVATYLRCDRDENRTVQALLDGI